jgi:hypothetical protein
VPGSVTDYPSLLFGYARLEHAVGTIGPSGGGIYRDVPMVRLQISGLNWFLAVATDVGTNPYAAVSYRGLTTAISNVPEELYLRTIANTASIPADIESGPRTRSRNQNLQATTAHSPSSSRYG